MQGWFSWRRVTLLGLPFTAAAVIWQLPALDKDGRSFENVIAVVEVTLLAVGLYSLALVSEQSRQTAKWNKLLSYHQFFGELISLELVKTMLAVAGRCGFHDAMDRVEPMTEASRAAVEADGEALKTVSAYLDEFEEFCGAVQAGVTDREYAYTLEATRVIRTWVVFGPFIRSQRARHSLSRCYLELERLGIEWARRRESEAQRKYTLDGVKPHV